MKQMILLGLSIWSLGLCSSLLAEEGPAPVRKTLRVLFIGNSQTYFSMLPLMFQDLANSNRDPQAPKVFANMETKGGVGLSTLWAEGKAAEKINRGGWDYVVIQGGLEVAQESAYAEFKKTVEQFSSLVTQQKGRVVLFATGHVEANKELARQIYQANVKLGKELGLPVAAGGMVWFQVWDQKPALDLYDADREHPNFKASYIYACCLYTAITGLSPIGLTNEVHRLVIPQDEATLFQTLAWQQQQLTKE